MKPFYCCFAGCLLPISSVTCESILLALHIHTDQRCANRHILSNLEHGINGVRDVWFTDHVQAQTPWCNCKLTTRLDIEKPELVTNLSCFSKRRLWLQWFPIAWSPEHWNRQNLPTWKRLKNARTQTLRAFLHLKCTMLQQQGCTGFTHRLCDLEYKNRGN